MGLSNFTGETFVAFIDISGFKEMMKNGQMAIKTLDKFYQAGYDALKRQTEVEGLFVSDCGVLFVKNGSYANEKLDSLLGIVKEINKRVLEDDLMLTTSIAYGNFIHQNKIEFPGISKNPIIGNAYINAFLDNEIGKPRIQPGQCRLLKDGLPDDFQSNNSFMIERKNYFQYFWNIESVEQISDFEKDYNNSYNQKYKGMLYALKKDYN